MVDVSYLIKPIDVPIQRILPSELSTFTFLAVNEKLSDFNMWENFSPFECLAKGLVKEFPVVGRNKFRIMILINIKINLKGLFF